MVQPVYSCMQWYNASSATVHVFTSYVFKLLSVYSLQPIWFNHVTCIVVVQLLIGLLLALHVLDCVSVL